MKPFEQNRHVANDLGISLELLSRLIVYDGDVSAHEKAELRVFLDSWVRYLTVIDPKGSWFEAWALIAWLEELAPSKSIAAQEVSP